MGATADIERKDTVDAMGASSIDFNAEVTVRFITGALRAFSIGSTTAALEVEGHGDVPRIRPDVDGRP